MAISVESESGHGGAKASSADAAAEEADRPTFDLTGKALVTVAHAFRTLAAAVRADLARVSAPAVRGLCREGRGIVQRLRQLDMANVARAASELSLLPGALLPHAARSARNALRSTAIACRQLPARTNILRGVAAIAIASVVSILVVFAWALNGIPWEQIAEGSLKPIVALETSDGTPLVAQGPYQGPYAVRQDFPPHLIDAVLISEDRRFYEHAGIDLRGVLRAIYRNVGAGEVVQGGSTITQQLIKILYLERE